MRNRCTLNIVFDRPDKRYHPGDQVTGHVEVEVNRDCACRGLNITVGWRTHGRGNSTRGSEQSGVLFTGEWTAGEIHRYPFMVTLPNGPYTYRGHLLNIDWFAQARADIPWSLDPRTTEDFLLTPLPDAPSLEPYHTHDPLGPDRSPEKRQKVANGGLVAGIILFSFLLVLGVPLAIILIVGDLARDDLYIMAGIGSVFVFIGLLITVFALRNRIAEKRLGSLTVDLPRRTVPIGEWLELAINIPQESHAHINQISAILVGREVVVSGSGTNRTTHTHTLHQDEHYYPEAENRVLKKGQSLSLRHRFPIPLMAPPSFHASDNDLEWKVEVHVDIDRWPDWRQEFHFEGIPSQQPTQSSAAIAHGASASDWQRRDDTGDDTWRTKQAPAQFASESDDDSNLW